MNKTSKLSQNASWVVIGSLLLLLMIQFAFGAATLNFGERGLNHNYDNQLWTATLVGGSQTFTSSLLEIDRVNLSYDDQLSATLFLTWEVTSGSEGAWLIKVAGDADEVIHVELIDDQKE